MPVAVLDTLSGTAPKFTTALTAGQTAVTALACTALPYALSPGQVVTASVGTANAETFTVSASAPAGALSIAVTSQTSANAHALGDSIGLPPQIVVHGDNSGTAQSNLSGDSGQNAALIAGNRKEVSFTTTTVQAVASTDVSNYRWVSVHLTSQGTSSVTNFQISNDNVNWSALLLQRQQDGANGTSMTVAGQVFAGPISARYFRLNVTGISAGTTAGVVEFFSTSITPVAPNVPSAADGISTFTGTGTAFPETFNGTTWDRQRSATSAKGTTGTGLLGVGALGFDGTNYQALKTSTTGQALVTVVDPSGSTAAVDNVPAHDGYFTGANTLETAGFNMTYNGSNWDRIRSAASAKDTTGTGVQAAGALGFDGTNYRALRVLTGSGSFTPGAAGAPLAVSLVRGDGQDFSGSENGWNSDNYNPGLALSVASLQYVWNPAGGSGVYLRTPSKFGYYAGASNGAAIWTPAAGKKFRLMAFSVMLSSEAIQASAGNLYVSLWDSSGSGDLFHWQVYVPSAATATQPLLNTGWCALPGNGYLGAAANGVLKLGLGAALTAGQVSVEFVGTEE